MNIIQAVVSWRTFARPFLNFPRQMKNPQKLTIEEIETINQRLVEDFGKLEMQFIHGLDKAVYQYRKANLNREAVWLKYSIKLSLK